MKYNTIITIYIIYINDIIVCIASTGLTNYK